MTGRCSSSRIRCVFIFIFFRFILLHSVVGSIRYPCAYFFQLRLSHHLIASMTAHIPPCQKRTTTTTTTAGPIRGRDYTPILRSQQVQFLRPTAELLRLSQDTDEADTERGFRQVHREARHVLQREVQARPVRPPTRNPALHAGGGLPSHPRRSGEGGRDLAIVRRRPRGSSAGPRGTFARARDEDG